MTVRQTRQLLNGLAAVCAVGCVAVLFWAFSEPRLSGADTPRVRQPTQANAQAKDKPVSDEDIAVAASRPLQGPLTLQKVTRPTVAPRTPPRVKSVAKPPRVSLLATVLDASSRTAIMQDVRGLTDQREVGETLSLLPSGMKLQAIESDHVRIALRGKSFRIALKGAGSVARSNTPRRSFDDDEEEDEGPDMSAEFDEDPPYVGEKRGMKKQ